MLRKLNFKTDRQWAPTVNKCVVHKPIELVYPGFHIEDTLYITNISYLKTLVSRYYNPRLCDDIVPITEHCFKYDIGMIILFINKDESGSFKIVSFMPITFNKVSNTSTTIQDINNIIALPALYLKNTDDLQGEKLETIINIARRDGFWHGKYGIGILNCHLGNKIYKMNIKDTYRLHLEEEYLEFEGEHIDIYKNLIISLYLTSLFVTCCYFFMFGNRPYFLSLICCFIDSLKKFNPTCKSELSEFSSFLFQKCLKSKITPRVDKNKEKFLSNREVQGNKIVSVMGMEESPPTRTKTK